MHLPDWYQIYHWTRRTVVGCTASLAGISQAIRNLVTICAKLAVAGVLLAYIGVTFMHLTNGFNLSTGLWAGFQDARLALTCPTNIQRHWQFINRSQNEHLQFVLSLNRGNHSFSDVCSGAEFPPDGMSGPRPLLQSLFQPPSREPGRRPTMPSSHHPRPVSAWAQRGLPWRR